MIYKRKNCLRKDAKFICKCIFTETINEERKLGLNALTSHWSSSIHNATKVRIVSNRVHDIYALIKSVWLQTNPVLGHFISPLFLSAISLRALVL